MFPSGKRVPLVAITWTVLKSTKYVFYIFFSTMLFVTLTQTPYVSKFEFVHEEYILIQRE